MTPITIEQAMQIAVAHHQAGRLVEAEGLYRRILAQFPEHAGALHLLGVLACEMGHTDAAIELIGRAIAIDPGVAVYHSNLGESYRRSGHPALAVASLRRAVELNPELAEAHHSLGIALKDQGRPDEAIDAYNRAVDLRPDYAAAHLNLGIALGARGRADEAITALNRAIELRPNLAEAYVNLGNELNEKGRHDEAIAACRRAIELRPDFADAHNNLGNALRAAGRLDEAIAAYDRAIALQPGHAPAHLNLGNALSATGRPDEAIAAYNRAIALQPDHALAHNNLGSALSEQGRHDEAAAALARALALQPDLAEAHNNLGNLLRTQDRLDEAAAALARALALQPDLAEAHINLGNVLKEQGRLDEALACFHRAVERKPDFAVAGSNLLCNLQNHPDYDARAILAEHRHWARRFAEPLAARIRPHTNDRDPDRKLRIGYLSADFRDHPIGRNVLSLFAHHDRRQTEVVAYSNARGGDGVTEQLRALADQWHETMCLGDPQLADRIRDDRIDILVDLALHTAGNRLLVFAYKPAPVQVSMLGMPATTGLATMDYRLTDPYFDPPGVTDGDYTERSIRLPRCIWQYHPPEEAPPVGGLPALANGFVTFGCLNQFAKVTRPALQLWINILRALPGSRLVIQAQPGGHRDAVRALFRDAGIAHDRVEFVARAPRWQYLRRYLALDLCLDPFPYNGHFTTLDALWMGVPVVTLAGRTGVGRGGVSALSNVGLPELIANTTGQYLDIAVRWASDLTALSELRAGLRPRMGSSALMDGKQYAADVEAAFRKMWTTWCGR